MSSKAEDVVASRPGRCQSFWDQLRDVVLSDAGVDFLRMLRGLHLMHSNDPAKIASGRAELMQLPDHTRLLEQAAELTLITGPDPELPPLSALGTQIADSAKQYCNWRGHADRLPPGVPREMVQGRRILDIGCGVGCWLLAFARNGASQLAGLDVIHASLKLSHILAEKEGIAPMLLVTGDGARVPFPDQTFDGVFSRLALNYMKSDDALREIARIIRPGGWLVLSLNTLPWDLRQLRLNLPRLQLKKIAFSVFALANGVLFHLTRRQITLRYHGRMHSFYSPMFHTNRTIRRDLARWGFDVVWDDTERSDGTPTFRANRRES